jgi:hypothetical protein
MKHALLSTWVPRDRPISSLTQLSISGNRLTGSLPVSWCQLTALDRLEVENNLVSGPIPSQYGVMPLTCVGSVSRPPPHLPSVNPHV